MDSDLPLIEIAGEDDSFLEQIPDPEDTHTIPNISNSYFACSPLQLSVIKPRLSHAKGFKTKMDPAKPSCSSTQSSSNKENIDVNKSEVPKLSVEPLQMKKRKKAGGYNLRKSLAWDRAFDTDEGVLDPFELSMITGAFSKSCREILPVIKEEGSKALCASTNCTNQSEDLPDMNSTPKEDEEKGACSVPRHTSLPQDNICSTPKATRKFLSTRGGAKSGSKGGGCPKPLAASSLKRPASASTVNVIRKDSKLPKLPASKTGSCSIPTHTNSTTQYSSHLKPNQIAKPAVNVHNPVSVKSSSTNVRYAQIKAKPSQGVTASGVKDSARNLANSFLEEQSSTNSRLLQVSGAISRSEVISQSKVPSTRLPTPEGQFSYASPTISLPPNLSVTNEKVINPKTLSIKPSGLRMPSPSLGFFRQSKARGSETSTPRSGGPYDSNLGSNIHSTHKFGMSRPPPVTGKKLLIASSSNQQCSSSSPLCAVSGKTVKSDPAPLNLQNMETEVQSDCQSSESLCLKQNENGNIEANPEILQPVDCTQLKETVLKQDSNFQIINNQVTPKGGSIKQYEGDYGTKLEHITAPFPYKDRKQENGGPGGVDDFRDQSPAGNTQQPALNGNLSSENCNSASITATKKNKLLEVCELSNQHPKCFESKSQRQKVNGGGVVVVADVCKALPLGHAQEKTPDDVLYSSNYNSDQCTVTECTKSLEVCESSEQRSKCFESTSHREHGNGGVVGVDYVSSKLSVEHAQQHAPSTSSYPRGCLEVCDYSDKSATNLEMKNASFASEPTWQLNREWHPDDSMLLVEKPSSEKPHCKEAISTVQFIFSERNDFSVRGSNVLNVINMEVAGQLRDDGTDADIVSEQTPIEEIHVCTTQPSSEGSDVPCKVVDLSSYNVVIEEAKSEMHDENSYNRQRMEATDDSSFQKTTAAEDSPSYLSVAGDDQGCEDIRETSHCQIQTANQTDKDVSRVHNVPESHLDAQIQIINGDKLVGSCSNDTPISHEQSTKTACPLDVFCEHPDLPGRSLIMQPVLVDNQYNLLSDSERSCKESLDGAPSSSPMIDSTEYNEFSIDRLIIQSMESSDQAVTSLDSNLQVNNEHSLSLRTTFAELSPIREISLVTGLIKKVFGEQPEVSNSYCEVEDVHSEYNPTILKDCLCPKKIFDSEEVQHDNVVESLTEVPEESFIYENDPNYSSVGVQVPILAEGIEFSEDGQSENKDKDATIPITSSENKMKLDIPLIKPPPNAVPFSDEWLAAIEAAGEDILTLKSGAVQNSPPDKSLPEPSPWSPVKRKNIQLGPFDCTKKVGNTLSGDLSS